MVSALANPPRASRPSFAHSLQAFSRIATRSTAQANLEITAGGKTDAIEDDRQAAGGHCGGGQGWWQ